MSDRTEHPHELLAEYVDGDLARGTREVVESHLATCATCREEVAHARRAVAALQALEPVPAPLGLGTPAIQRARSARRRVLSPRWAAGLAAAAVIVAAVAVGARFLVGNGSGGGAAGDRAATQAPAEGGGAPGQPEAAGTLRIPAVVQSDEDYVDDALRALASDVASDGRATPPKDSPFVAQDDLTAEAAACLSAAGLSNEAGDEALYVEAARYRGDRAFVAVFRRGGEQGVVLWVIARPDCRILYTTIHSP